MKSFSSPGLQGNGNQLAPSPAWYAHHKRNNFSIMRKLSSTIVFNFAGNFKGQHTVTKLSGEKKDTKKKSSARVICKEMRDAVTASVKPWSV